MVLSKLNVTKKFQRFFFVLKLSEHIPTPFKWNIMAFKVFKLIQNIHFKAIFWTIPISRKTQDCSWEPRSGEQGDQNVSEQGHPGPEECCQKVWDFEDLCSEHSQVQEHQALSQSKGAGSGAKPQGYLGLEKEYIREDEFKAMDPSDKGPAVSGQDEEGHHLPVYTLL